MGQALYRQYRPKSLADVAGQEHVTATLKKAIDSNQVSHAYLLTGPRGVGKTTVARIMAHMVNGLAYDDDLSHIDIIEIDAASNRRIDEIRDLREKVYTAPSELKYKVYIIDEVHMLTREAFNALLKTLEEPPAHVIFILATTDTHKLPETIISRTQRYSFKPITIEEAVKRLKIIATKEKIKVTDGALKLLAEHGEGSLRDSISLLDQIKNYSSEIDEEAVKELLGLPPESALNNLLSLTFEKASPAELMSAVSELFESGYQASVIAHNLSKILREWLVNGRSSYDDQAILGLLTDLIDIPASMAPERLLEITLLKTQTKNGKQPSVTAKLDKAVEVKDDQPIPREVKAEETVVKVDKPLARSDAELWQDILKNIKSQYNTLYGILRMAQPSFEGDTLKLAFAFSFHQKRINEKSNKQIIEDLAQKLSGRKLVLTCLVDKSIKAEPGVNIQAEADYTQISDNLSTISSIFNGAELLES